MDSSFLTFILLPVIGAFTGWAAHRVMKNVAEDGIVLDLILGIGAAFIGGWVPRVISGDGVSFLETLVLAFAAAAFVLGALRFVRKPLTATT